MGLLAPCQYKYIANYLINHLCLNNKQFLNLLKSRWVDNVKTDLTEIGWDGMDWIELAQDRNQWRALVNMVMNLRVP
jgi:hypothetical protein